MCRSTAAIRFCDTFHGRFELADGKPAARRPRIDNGRDRDRNVGKDRVVGDVDLGEIGVFIGVVRYHQHKWRELRFDSANGLGQLHGAERAVILEITAVVADFARRRNNGETRGIVSRGAQAYVVKVARREERQFVAHIIPDREPLNAAEPVGWIFVRQ
jgi:hypothetical protein